MHDDCSTVVLGLLEVRVVREEETTEAFTAAARAHGVEGKNNRIKIIKRMAYGYRNSHDFRQRILLTNDQEVTTRAA